jgi:hypothetical protein
MELLPFFKRPVTNLVRIHTKNYRHLLPESIHLFNVYQKFFDNDKEELKERINKFGSTNCGINF